MLISMIKPSKYEQQNVGQSFENFWNIDDFMDEKLNLREDACRFAYNLDIDRTKWIYNININIK